MIKFLLFKLRARDFPHYQKFCCFGLPKRKTIEPHSTDLCANVPLRSTDSACMITEVGQPGKYGLIFFN